MGDERYPGGMNAFIGGTTNEVPDPMDRCGGSDPLAGGSIIPLGMIGAPYGGLGREKPGYWGEFKTGGNVGG